MFCLLSKSEAAAISSDNHPVSRCQYFGGYDLEKRDLEVILLF